MNVLENLIAYFILFDDSILSSLILPIKKVTIFKIMCYFGNYNSFFILIIASLGSIIGGVINWCFGNIICYARIKYHNTPTVGNDILSNNNIKKFMLLSLLLFSWTYICGSIIAVLSGYLRIKITHIILMMLFSYCTYYTILLYANSSTF